MKKRLILDFDGTLVEFKPVERLDELLTPGYFSKLFVFENVVLGIIQKASRNRYTHRK